MKYLIYVFIIICGSINAQVSFVNSNHLLPSPTFRSWLQKGAADMNADGFDDIVRAKPNGEFYILYQSSIDNSPFTEKYIGTPFNDTPLSIIIGDIDNNGFPDILTGGEYTGCYTLMANSDGSAYSIIRLPNDNIFTQASALADINEDGLLDLFVCHDDGLNAIWQNNGANSFIRDNMGIPLATVPTSDNSGNYGVVFADINNDNQTDFYISKCRAGVTDPSDPRRINQFFVKNGNIYTEQSFSHNLRDSSQSWITEFQDFDLDGDLDALIINHYSPSRLLENNGQGFFTDITANSGLTDLPNGILQCAMKDFNNDGYPDLLVTGNENARFYMNNGNRTFSLLPIGPLSNTEGRTLRSFTLGDFNSDGFLDIYGSYFWGDSSRDNLWLNQENNNNWVRVTLKGHHCNRSAIGAKLVLKSGQKIITQEIRAGESYGLSHSHSLIFGLGSNTNIDELTVYWPNGEKEVFTNIIINRDLFINEGIKF